MRTPPDQLPEQPSHGRRDANIYLFALSIGSLMFAVLVLAYGLIKGY